VDQVTVRPVHRNGRTPEERAWDEAASTSDLAMQVRNLGVQYNLRFTKKTRVRTTFQNMLGRGRNETHFWALQNVSFELKRGESLGVIGPNGAGKSTLLLVLAGIIQPSEGTVEVDGQISTLLSLSAGFDQELTGRDNIMLAGALMGIPDRVMSEIQDDVVEFAELGAFIDAPLKTYSSGMRARLGFSIATAVDPDIMLLDEVLSTGDEVFRAKSRARIIEVLRAAKAVVMVTHDLSWVTEFCTRAMLLENGHVVAEGHPDEVVAIHMEHSEQRKLERQQRIERMARGEMPIESVFLKSEKKAAKRAAKRQD
jgi:ABC-2 type transport system ATP-binding protein